MSIQKLRNFRIDEDCKFENGKFKFYPGTELFGYLDFATVSGKIRIAKRTDDVTVDDMDSIIPESVVYFPQKMYYILRRGFFPAIYNAYSEYADNPTDEMYEDIDITDISYLLYDIICAAMYTIKDIIGSTIVSRTKKLEIVSSYMANDIDIVIDKMIDSTTISRASVEFVKSINNTIVGTLEQLLFKFHTEVSASLNKRFILLTDKAEAAISCMITGKGTNHEHIHSVDITVCNKQNMITGFRFTAESKIYYDFIEPIFSKKSIGIDYWTLCRYLGIVEDYLKAEQYSISHDAAPYSELVHTQFTGDNKKWISAWGLTDDEWKLIISFAHAQLPVLKNN